MKRVLVLSFAVALSLSVSISLAAGPVDVPIPEPAPAPEVMEPEPLDLDVNTSGSEASEATEQASEELVTEPSVERYEALGLESELRQNRSCTYTCSNPLMCPNIIDLPRASCVNGCCVW